MTVSTKLQPNNADQVGANYKGAIDATTHVHDRVAGAFACHQNDQGSPDAPDLTVRVDAGALVRAGLVPLEVAAQSTSAMAAPSGNPRKDIVYIDNTTGAVGVATGAEAGSPSDPTVPASKIAVARINWTVGMTEITNADIDDLRVAGQAPEFTGPDISGSPQSPGTAGIVPAPQPGDETKFLRGDATWQDVTGEDQVARDMAASALILADYNGTTGTKGAFYLADPFTSDSLSTKTNATYDASGDYYYNLAAVSGAAGTNIGNMTGGGGLAAAFNGNTNQSTAASAQSSAGTDGKVGKDWGSGTPKTISRAQVYGSNDAGYVNSADPSVTINLYGTTDGTTTGGTLLGTTGAFTDSVTNKTIDVSAPQSLRSIYVEIASSGGTERICAECIFSEITNMTLRPSAAPLLTANPSDVFGYFVIDPQQSIVMGTDVVGKLSIDGGSTLATGTWTRVGSIATDYEIWRLDADVSGQAGSSLVWELTTPTTKSIRLKQCGGCVPIY